MLRLVNKTRPYYVHMPDLPSAPPVRKPRKPRTKAKKAPQDDLLQDIPPNDAILPEGASKSLKKPQSPTPKRPKQQKLGVGIDMMNSNRLGPRQQRLSQAPSVQQTSTSSAQPTFALAQWPDFERVTSPVDKASSTSQALRRTEQHQSKIATTFHEHINLQTHGTQKATRRLDPSRHHGLYDSIPAQSTANVLPGSQSASINGSRKGKERTDPKSGNPPPSGRSAFPSKGALTAQLWTKKANKAEVSSDDNVDLLSGIDSQVDSIEAQILQLSTVCSCILGR